MSFSLFCYTKNHLFANIELFKILFNEEELDRESTSSKMEPVLMSMQDWVDQTNQFLSNNRRKVLEGKGKIYFKGE